MNISKTNVITDLNELPFNSLKKRDKFLYIEYNSLYKNDDINFLEVLSNFNKSFFVFKGIKIDTESVVVTSGKEIKLLVYDNKMIYEFNNNNESYDSYHRNFVKNFNNVNINEIFYGIMETSYSDDKYKNWYCIIPYQNNSYILFHCYFDNHDPKFLKVNYFVSILDKNNSFQMNYVSSFEEFSNLLNTLSKIFKSKKLDEFKSIISYSILNIKDIINNKQNQINFQKFYSFDISKLIQPIYEEDKFKIYIDYINHKIDNTISETYLYVIDNNKSFFINGDFLRQKNDKYNYNIKLEIMMSIHQHMNNMSIIDPFSGKINNSYRNKQLYKDYDSLIISSSYFGDKYYYIKYNNIYIAANKKQIKEIQERYTVLNNLTN